MKDLLDFIREHHTGTLAWPAGRLEEYVRWHLGIGGVGVIRNNGAISGVALARLVRDPATAKDWQYDEDGQTVYVDMAVSTNPAALARMWILILKRFGVRKWAAFRRKKYRGRLKIYQYGTFLRNLARKEGYSNG